MPITGGAGAVGERGDYYEFRVNGDWLEKKLSEADELSWEQVLDLRTLGTQIVIEYSDDNIVWSEIENTLTNKYIRFITEGVPSQGFRFKGLDGTGASAGTYTTPSAIPIDIGGISSGKIFDGTPIEDVLTALFFPYQSPAFTSFGITGSTTTKEVGQTLSLGTTTFTWATSNSANVEVDSLSINDVTGGSSITTGLSNTGSFSHTFADITKSTNVSHTWRITGVNTQGASFNRTYVVNWLHRVYQVQDPLSSLTGAEIKAKSVGTLKTTGAGTYAFAGGGFAYICVPTALGALTQFKDPSNNMTIAMATPYTVDIVNDYGLTIPYNIYKSYNSMGGAISIQAS
jgi:hypothetical protein